MNTLCRIDSDHFFLFYYVDLKLRFIVISILLGCIIIIILLALDYNNDIIIIIL